MGAGKQVQLMTLGITLAALLAAAVLVSGTAASQTSKPARSAESEAPRAMERRTLRLPLLQGLSRELTKLRRSVDFVGEATFRSGASAPGAGPRSLPLVHLSGGLMASPRVSDLEPGSTAVLRYADRLYRLIYLGADRTFAGYWRLRDNEHHTPLPSPRMAKTDTTDPLGDLVLVVAGRSARLRLLSTWRFTLPPVPLGKSGSATRSKESKDGDPDGLPQKQQARLAAWRKLRFYRLSESPVADAACVLALDGSLLGVVCSPGSGRSRTPAAKTAPIQVVVDGRLLLRQARQAARTKPGVATPDPSFGVQLVPAGDGPGDDGKGFSVQQLFEGGPGARAGVRKGDRWLAIDGKILESFAQIRAILDGVHSGQKVTIRYRRGKKAPLELDIRPD